MASVELRPGDSLNIVWYSVHDTPLGEKEVESSFQFTYEELVARLKNKSRKGKSRRSGSEGARFSRVIALSTNAIQKGKWSTGADIDKNLVFDKLIQQFETLKATEYSNITGNAKKSLIALYKNKVILQKKQKDDLKNILLKTHIIEEG